MGFVSFRSAKILVLLAEMSGIKVFSLPYICIFPATSQSSPCVGFYLVLIYIFLTPLTVLTPLSPALSNKKLQSSTSNKI